MPSLLQRFLVSTIAAVGPLVCLPAQVLGYHDVSSASHQASFTSLTGQGYRLTQLSVAGGLAAPRYSAIWVQTTGPAWVSAHGMTQSGYTTWRASRISQGYRPKLVTAAGTGSDTVFAAIYVNDGVTVFDATAVSEAAFEASCASHREAGRIAVSADIHGSTTPLYCAVWEPNPSDTAWGWKVDLVHADFAATWNAYYPVNARIAALGMSDSQRYVSIWYDDRVGAWAARSNYTSSGYATQYTTLTTAGYEPIVIASGGTGTGLRMAGAFAQQRTPLGRTMTYTGVQRPEFATFDTYMTGVLQSSGARNAALAITKGGRLVFARGYTWAEAGATTTQPTSLFRIASLTKVVTSMAIHEMVDDGIVSLADRPRTLLGAPSGSFNFNNCSLLNCLEYTSGLVRNYDGYSIADHVTTGTPILPATHAQGIQWLAAQPPEHGFLGAYGEYSNSAFLLAGQVVRQLSGYSSLQSYLQAQIYNPLGITRGRVAASEVADLASGELRGYPTQLDLVESTVQTDRRLVPENWKYDFALSDSSGGMAFAVVDWARLMAGTFGLGPDWITLSPAWTGSMLTRHQFPAWSEGPGDVTPGSFSWSQRPSGVWVYHKGGTLSDTHTRTIWRSDGISITVLVARNGSSTSMDELNDRIEQVASWPTNDLFPNYGMPTFPQRPDLVSVDTTVLPNVTNTPFVLTGERLDTVTTVHFGASAITATTPANWHAGWFRVVSPTQLELYVPQGLPGGVRGIYVTNGVGNSGSRIVQLTTGSGGPHLSSPTTVSPGQSYRVYAGAGVAPTPSLAALVLSTSLQPSFAPGIVDLQLGAQFADLIVADFQLFDGNRATFWSLPPLPLPSVHLQAVIFDPVTPTPFPLPTTNLRTTLLQ